MARKKIKKVAVTELDPITGSIVDGTNIEDKEHNTYSANTIDGLFTENKNGFLTKLYSSTSFEEVGRLSEDIHNFYGVLIVSKYENHNTTGSTFLPVEAAINTNIPIKAFNFNDENALIGNNVIIYPNGQDISVSNWSGYILGIYGVFRK